MRFALLLFIAIPVVELMVMIELGSQIGSLATIALVFATAILGVGLIRSQGAVTLARAQVKIREGQLPAEEAVHGFMLGLAGVCLLIPGFVTDAVGGLLLLPPVRKALLGVFLQKLLSGNSQFKMKMGRHFNQHGDASGDVYDGEFSREDNDLIDKK